MVPGPLKLLNYEIQTQNLMTIHITEYTKTCAAPAPKFNLI